ncbi:D-2-hydroxyacid dehydrogenase [Adhaeribacter pallidiroseus]|uniref:D-lactate dehydrogenase n=1 Tax=Adhaeribacter pallidiroseus TaxID=2072847 RepID=A0A369QLK7_9BACT|nr:D-2-hydroxyacid dehydrogenase [Adhaeribacter pallidiroseus]RDC64525.1 D-lactate dehydrogenase [Adhaeribacter pallidiroseus]
MNLFIYTSLDTNHRNILRQQLPPECNLVFRTELSPAEVEKAFQAAEVIMGNPPVDWFAQVPPKLVFWQLDSAGFDQYQNVKVSALTANMGDFFARPCAETMVGGILAFYRGIPELVKRQTTKEWRGNQIRPQLDLLGTKKVMVLGAGTIGMACKQMLKGFGCEVKTTARRNPEADIHSFEEILKNLPYTDVVVNTLPGAADKFVKEEFLQAMKPGSLYASVGRGSTTDEQALLVALQAGKLAGAVLDVTEQEPLPASSPFWEMENVLLTQHTGGGYFAEEAGKINQFLKNFTLFRNGEPITDQVNLAQGY